jgi:hypothetical protein
MLRTAGLGLIGAIGVGMAPAAQAQTITPVVMATAGSLAQTGAAVGIAPQFVSLSGSGFTSWGDATIELLNTATGAVIETATEQALPSAAGGTISTTLLLPFITSDPVTVEVIDVATGAMSNQVVVTPTLS